MKKQARTISLCAPIPAGWSLSVTKAKPKAVSDKIHPSLDAQSVDPSIYIMSMKARAAAASASSSEFLLNPPQHRPDADPKNVGIPRGPDVLLQFPQNFNVVGCEPNRGGSDDLLSHADGTVTRVTDRENYPNVLPASSDGSFAAALHQNSGLSDETAELITTVPLSDIFPGLQAFVFVDGEFKPPALALPSLQGAWKYLSEQESNEENPHQIDDLRIAKLCLLQMEAGNPDPWRFAFWTYMGITPEKWQGIRAEREAFERTLGPTLAAELENPLFLESLDSLLLAQMHAKRPQARFCFSPKEEGVA